MFGTLVTTDRTSMCASKVAFVAGVRTLASVNALVFDDVLAGCSSKIAFVTCEGALVDTRMLETLEHAFRGFGRSLWLSRASVMGGLVRRGLRFGQLLELGIGGCGLAQLEIDSLKIARLLVERCLDG